MSFSKLPPETLLNIADNLSTKDHLALSLTSKKLRGVIELLLYVDITVTVKPGTGDTRLDVLLDSLSSDKGRPNRVRRLTVAFTDLPTPQQLKIMNDIALKLPRLSIFNVDYDSLDPNITAGRARPVSPLPFAVPSFLKATTLSLVAGTPSSSLINVSWFGPIVRQATGDILVFTDFVQHHVNIRCLTLQAPFIPNLDAGILPNLEVLQAPLDVVLKLLPGRPIRRVSTVVRKGVEYPWKEVIDALSSIEVLSCVQTRRDQDGRMWLPEMIGWMKNLQVLHLSRGFRMVPAMLRYTKIRLFRPLRIPDAKVEQLFEMVPSLEAWKCFTWTCNPREEWLADWEESA
ncbi:hypothetical protein AB1N83_012822 [Pleurotus pulmonarius]